MPGLDRTYIELIDPNEVISHVKADVRSDFILAPHFNAVFNRASDDLWQLLKQQLSAGNYQPELPISMSVPKERFFTRPGSILNPTDRFLYQAMIDLTISQIEGGLDRERSFSHIPTTESGVMFEPNHIGWERFQSRIADVCDQSEYILKADISHYFERIPQHHLINLMSAADCPSEVMNLLEEMLLAFRERNSVGIIQGVYPSDALGNFFLSDFDAYCELAEIPSARYVDDFYMGYDTENEARRGLGNLIESLRRDGLHLNEAKTKIMLVDDVLQEETAIDQIFDEIRDDVENDESYERASPYGFEVEWDDEEEPSESGDDEIQNAAVARLILDIDDHPDHTDQIEKFCLPILRSAASDVAVDYVLGVLGEKPHQTRLFFSYISTFVKSSSEVRSTLETMVANQSVSDYQRMYLLGTLLRARSVQRSTVNSAIQWMQNPQVAKETRAMASIFAAKHGAAVQKRAVRTSYEGEQSEYVRSAILYASRYFSVAEKRTCKRAWGGHSTINSLIAKAI